MRKPIAVMLLVLLAPIGASANHLAELNGERAVAFGGRTWTWEQLADKRAEAPGRFDANHPTLGWVLSHPEAAVARRDLDPARFDRFHPYLGWLLGGLRPPTPVPPPVVPPDCPPCVSPPIHIVPEPPGLILAATGLLGLLAAIRRRAL